MNIYFVRHGQTEWNVLKKVQGKADISLNKNGEIQALETAKMLEGKKIDLIISSPLKRARQTADLICQGRNIDIIIDKRIEERDFGEFEGLKTSQFNFNEFWSYKANVDYDNAENIRDFFKRVYGFIEDIVNKYSDKNILIVSHGGVSIPFNCYFNGLPNIECLLPLCLKNCEVATYKSFNKEN